MSDPAAPIPPEPSSETAAAPAPPAQSTESAPASSPAAAASSGSTGLQPNLAAALASFFLLVGGIVFLVLEKKDQFVRFYAMQSIFLGGLSLAVSIAVTIAMAILHGIPLIGVLFTTVSVVIRLAIFVAWVVLVIKAYTGKEWEIPILGKLARQQLAGSGAKPF